MKTLKQIRELYTQDTEDGKKFVDKHKVVKTPDANKNGDDVFNASNVKGVKRQPDHGYDPGDDAKVYEEVKNIKESAKNPDHIKRVEGSFVRGEVIVTTNAGAKHTISAKNTGGKMPKPGEHISKYVKEDVELNEVGYQSPTGDAASPSAGGRPKPISIFNTGSSPKLNPPGSKPDVVHLQNKMKAAQPENYSRAQKVLNRPLNTLDIERTPEGSAGSRTTGRPLFSAVKTQNQIKANPLFRKEAIEQIDELDDAAGGYPVNKKPNTTPPPKDPKAKPQATAKKPTHYVVMPGEKVVEETEEVDLDEVMKPSMGAAAYIKDFVHSKNPKFAGKSKKERIKQALGAFYAAKRGE